MFRNQYGTWSLHHVSHEFACIFILQVCFLISIHPLFKIMSSYLWLSLCIRFCSWLSRIIVLLRKVIYIVILCCCFVALNFEFFMRVIILEDIFKRNLEIQWYRKKCFYFRRRIFLGKGNLLLNSKVVPWRIFILFLFLIFESFYFIWGYLSK